jgi:hypothetical protein
MKFGGVTRFVLLGKSISLDVELKENGYWTIIVKNNKPPENVILS